ncbi:hypothetical protein [Streptomyces sp. YIM S03343]
MNLTPGDYVLAALASAAATAACLLNFLVTGTAALIRTIRRPTQARHTARHTRQP